MHSLNRIIDLSNAGLDSTITFTKESENLEGYCEPGMKAKVVDVQLDRHHNMIKITVDYNEFLNHNKQFESSNYYDKLGNPTLNAREAGYYGAYNTGREDIYIMIDESQPEVFTIDDSTSNAVYALYKASGTTISYVAWLEKFMADTLKFEVDKS